MKIVDWQRIGSSERARVLQRPAQAVDSERTAAVANILEQVRREGDAALTALTWRFDGCNLLNFAVTRAEFDGAAQQLDFALIQAMKAARARLESFHGAAAPRPVRVDTAPGVICEQILRPVRRIGLYVPAGTAPLPSTALMLGVPARLAGCAEIVLCTPPRRDGDVDPAVLYAAELCGVTHVFRLGGAQAVAAMAQGTESVPRCDKLFGPGNAWVNEAKQQAAATPGGPAIDMPAGPSELLVIADAAADPRFVAADLLSQAEHGPDSQVLLLTDGDELARAVAAEINRQLVDLPRAEIVRAALAHSHIVRVASLDAAAAISNTYAPEHLILNVVAPRALLESIDCAGSVFLGPWSPESVGDYASGTNHVLPTAGHARAWSGLSVASFLKQMTVQELSTEGLRGVGPDAEIMARAEGLDAHARAIDRRLSAMGPKP